jgi:cyclopropane fatty-acyl-phospholipid synthase-like methyltransferase
MTSGDSVQSGYGEPLKDGDPESPAAERNKQPILDAIRAWLPATGTVLEIASGTGQHIVHFARALPALTWQPTDTDEGLLGTATRRVRAAGLRNVRMPLRLDVLDSDWPVRRAEAVISINMIHIAPPAATEALFSGAARVLANGGPLFLYGPYRRGGRHTAPSNEAFDQSLRARNPDWGVRDLDDVARGARGHGFRLADVVSMPVNNFTIIFTR